MLSSCWKAFPVFSPFSWAQRMIFIPREWTFAETIEAPLFVYIFPNTIFSHTSPSSESFSVKSCFPRENDARQIHRLAITRKAEKIILKTSTFLVSRPTNLCVGRTLTKITAHQDFLFRASRFELRLQKSSLKILISGWNCLEDEFISSPIVGQSSRTNINRPRVLWKRQSSSEKLRKTNEKTSVFWIRENKQIFPKVRI